MSNYKYKFSVVIPIYNVEKFLEELIKSVINQTIDFQKNIQLILVNDGSKDNSEKICLKYKRKYPKNVVYIFQENAGVSAARNNGMRHIEGKYVNFLDGDDKWSLDAFEKIWDFFEKENEEVDLVACRMKFFDARKDYHLLDYKFKKTRVIDTLEDYNFLQLHITSSIIKSEVAKNFKFDSRIKYGEDANYVNEIILEKHKFGVLAETVHFYRRRTDESSAVQNKDKSIDWYTNTVEYVYKNLMKQSIKKYGRIIPYIQYLVMYDLQWRIKQEIPEFLGENVKNQYISDIIELLSNIEDYVICNQKNIWAEHKIYLLSLKYGRDIRNELDYQKGRLYFNNLPIYNLKGNRSIIKLDFMNVEKNILYVEGMVTVALPKDMFDIYIITNSKKNTLITLEEGKKSLDTQNVYSFKHDRLLYNYTFKTQIPLKDVKKINFVFMYKKEIANELKLKFNRYTGLYEGKGIYKIFDKYILKYIKKDIIVQENTSENRIKMKLKFLKRLIINERKIKVIIIRAVAQLYKFFKQKEIWLISDREEKANDNGEQFFKYVKKVKNKNIKSYFVINKNSKDYRRIRKIGKTVDPKSFKYKILFLNSSKIISSQANDNVINAFGKSEKFYRDLVNFKFIFLQHGIIKNDLSSWLKKRDKNIRIFVTSAKKEYNSIINGDYYYTEKEVKLTGLPRYDKLVDKKEKSILIIPTQRRKLVEWNPADKYGKTYNPKFKESDFYQFYNSLINDPKLLKVLKKYEYKIRFGLHPLLLKQSDDFEKNDMVELIGNDIDYQEEFSKNAIMLTDYSSVAFDFSYLKKPTIFAQFDKDTFYEGQVYTKGYFEDEIDSFGPICYDYDSTINELIKCVENDAKVDEKYLKRIDNFYEYNDKNNCKRV